MLRVALVNPGWQSCQLAPRLCRSLVWGMMFMLGMALVSGFASVPGVRYSAVPQEVCVLPYASFPPKPGQTRSRNFIHWGVEYHGC